MALRRMLASPKFVFRVERDPAGVAAGRRVSPRAISSWRRGSRSSCGAASRTRSCCARPSAAAEDAGGARAAGAADARRSEGAGARQQLRRPVAAPAESARPRSRTRSSFPTSTTTCGGRWCARSELFFKSVIDEDRNVLDLMTADYTFVNERLARHYGIRGVYGSQFRRVTLDRRRAARAARQGRHPDGDLARASHVAGAARQVGAREHHRRRAGAAARRRAGAQRRGAARTSRDPDAKRSSSIAPTRPAPAAIACSIRSGSRSRTTTRSARGARATAARSASRSMRRASWSTARRWTASSRCARRWCASRRCSSGR